MPTGLPSSAEIFPAPVGGPPPASPWRAPGAVLLVSCYELGRPPLAAAWEATLLARAGYAPRVADIALGELGAGLAEDARLAVLFAPMHTALRLAVRTAGAVRGRNPGCRVGFSGLYAALNREYLLAGGAEFALAGGDPGWLVSRVKALEAGQPCGSTPPPGRAAPGAFPVPDRTLLAPLERYARLVWKGERRLAGYVEASRGCRHLCRHCPVVPIYRGRMQVVPVEAVLADIRQQAAAGAEHVTFGDPDFLNGPGHALRVVERMHGEFPALTFDFTARIEHLLRHRRAVEHLARLGALFVTSAVESVSDRVLALLEKGHTRRDVVEAGELTRGCGLVLRPTWIPFTPWSSAADYMEMLEFIVQQGWVGCVDPIQYAVRLLVPPGSALLEQPGVRAVLGPLDPAAFAYRWEHPDPHMDLLQAQVQSLAARQGASGDPPGGVFPQVWDLACAAAGARPLPQGARLLSAEVQDAPRLTEPWFC